MSEQEATGAASGRPGKREAGAFDIRSFVGLLIGIDGVVLFLTGIFGTSDAEIEKAAGVNINLYAGLGMLIVGIIFLLWAFTRPLGQEIAESEQASRSTGGDGEGTRRPGDAGR